MSFIDLSDYNTIRIISNGSNPVMMVKKIDTNQIFALKKIKNLSFQRHLKILQSTINFFACSHPNILKLIGYTIIQDSPDKPAKSEDTIFLLTDIYERSLEEVIVKKTSENLFFSWEEIVKIFKCLFDALLYLQNSKIAHRDVKPSNVLVGKNGEIVLGDFSEAFKMGEFCKKVENVVGTPYYMSPELKDCFTQGEENCDFSSHDPWKSDIYSFGMTMIDVCTLSIREKKSTKEKIEFIKKLYNPDLSELINLMITHDFNQRPDFLSLTRDPRFIKLFGEVDIRVGDNFSHAKKANGFVINGLSDEFEELMNEIKESGISEDIQREFKKMYEIAKKIEKDNHDLKFRQTEKEKKDF